jgi:hypothetical protein
MEGGVEGREVFGSEKEVKSSQLLFTCVIEPGPPHSLSIQLLVL